LKKKGTRKGPVPGNVGGKIQSWSMTEYKLVTDWGKDEKKKKRH